MKATLRADLVLQALVVVELLEEAQDEVGVKTQSSLEFYIKNFICRKNEKIFICINRWFYV